MDRPKGVGTLLLAFWLAHSPCLMEELDALHAPEQPPAADPVVAPPPRATEVFSGAAPPVPAVPKPVPPVVVPLPAPETASYRVSYGMLGQVAAATISVSPGTLGLRTVHAVGRGNGAVLGFGQTEKEIESDFDLQTLKSTRWTITRQNGNEKVTDIAEQTELGKVSLIRKRPGRPDQVDSFTRTTAVLDPLGLLMRIRFGPMSAPSSFEILDGHALWVISFSSIRTTGESPPALQLNGHVEPIYWDGTPDKERTGRDFSLFLSNDSARTPIRLIVPFGLGHARAEIIQLSRRTEATSREGMTNPETMGPVGFAGDGCRNMKQSLRGAVVGYGFIAGQGHAPTYAKHMSNGRAVEITAVADICEARRQAAHERFPSARIYNDHATLLAAEAARLDFVDITTPPAHHAEIAHAALSLGLHVLCEKPMATSGADASAMLQHAADARRVIFPCHNYKHAPVIKVVRGILDEGVIGPVHLATMQTFRNTHAKGVNEWRPDWRRERVLSGGGIAMDHGSHTFYLAFDWMRAYPTQITAHSSTSAGCDTEDVFGCTLTFPTGVVSAHLSWTAGVRKVMYTLHGSKGAIRVEDEDVELAVLEAGPGVVAPGSPGQWRFERRVAPSDWMDASHVGWFSSLFDEFRGAIARQEFVGKDAKEASLCVDMIERGYRSVAEGSRMVELPGTIDDRLLRATRMRPHSMPGRRATVA